MSKDKFVITSPWGFAAGMSGAVLADMQRPYLGGLTELSDAIAVGWPPCLCASHGPSGVAPAPPGDWKWSSRGSDPIGPCQEVVAVVDVPIRDLAVLEVDVQGKCR